MPLPLRRALLVFAPLAAFCWPYAPVFASLASDWDADEDRAHGVLIVPIAMYLAWRRRGDLRDAAVVPSPLAGGALLLASLAVLTIGSMASQFLARLSILSTIVA